MIFYHYIYLAGSCAMQQCVRLSRPHMTMWYATLTKWQKQRHKTRNVAIIEIFFFSLSLAPYKTLLSTWQNVSWNCRGKTTKGLALSLSFWKYLNGMWITSLSAHTLLFSYVTRSRRRKYIFWGSTKALSSQHLFLFFAGDLKEVESKRTCAFALTWATQRVE